MRAGQKAAVPGARGARRDRGDGRLLPRRRLRRLLPAALHARARPRARHHVGPARRHHRPTATARLEEGMIFVMHPNQYIPETGYLMCGEPVVITPRRRQGAVRARGRARQRGGVTMRTVHPSIIIGSYVWDQDRVPRDEFQIRMAALNRVMDANGWKAVLIYGDAREHSALAYFSNFTPRLRWGMALIPREGEPRLLVSMSSRDVPAMKLMTWIPDVHVRLELGDRVRSLARALRRRRPDRHRQRRLRPDAAAAVPLAGEKPRQPLPPAGGRRRRSQPAARCGRASCSQVRDASQRGAGRGARPSCAAWRAARTSRRRRSQPSAPRA